MKTTRNDRDLLASSAELLESLQTIVRHCKNGTWAGIKVYKQVIRDVETA